MKKKAPIDGPDGVDRWTSNGYGLIIDGKKVEKEPEKETEKKRPESDRYDEIDEE